MTRDQDNDDELAPRMRRALHSLPQELSPPDDAWPAVRARLTPRDTRSPRWRPLIGLVAAALLLVVLGTMMLTSPNERPLLTTVADGGPATGTDTGASTLEQLKTELEARRDVLSPETIATVEQNLRAIDAAIAQTAKALSVDPGNVQLELMLTQVTRQREQFVRDTRSLVGDL